VRWNCAATRSRAVAITVSITALAVLCPGSGFADVVEITRNAGLICPQKSDSIHLVSEQVNIIMPHDDAPGRAICAYRLKNLSLRIVMIDLALVTGGAPAHGPHPKLEVEHQAASYRMEALDKTRWAAILSDPPDSLPVVRLTIPGEGVLMVNTVYGVDWSSGNPEGETPTRDFTYHTGPSAFWEGKVDEAEISLAFDEMTASLLRCFPTTPDKCVSTEITPGGFEWFSRGIVWRMEPWDPAGGSYRIRVGWEEEGED